MRIAHVALATTIHDITEYLVALVDGLSQRGCQQYILTRDAGVNHRLAVYPDVVSGPVVRSAVTACCFMHEVDLVHAHDDLAGQTALMLHLTRSTPYVLEHSSGAGRPSPITTMVRRRAATVVCRSKFEAKELSAGLDDTPVVTIEALRYGSDDDAGDGVGREVALENYLRLYRLAADRLSYPNFLL